MSNILKQISGVILAGTNVEDQQMFDGIRNLANMSVISYPKARLLQIILDPRIIASEAPMLIKCNELKFRDIRKQLVEDLGNAIENKEIVIMLMSFVNQLLDNDETVHIDGKDDKCDIKNYKINKSSNIRLLYKKCQDLGLPYGFLNLFPSAALTKIARSRHKIVDQIVARIEDQDEFKNIIHLLSVNYERGIDIVKIVSTISKSEEGSFRYVMSLPEPIIEILLDCTDITSRKLSHERIDELLNIYNRRQDIFMSVKKKPLLAKLFILHDNCELMNNFLDVIGSNNRKISAIHSFNSSLSAFLFSHISGKSQKEDINSLMELAKDDIKRCKLIISNMPIVRNLGLNISFLCELASQSSEIFDLIFDKRSENLDIIYNVKKNKKISAEEVIKDLLPLRADKARNFFYKMSKKYD